MTVSDVWQDIGAGRESSSPRSSGCSSCLWPRPFFCFMAALPLTWPQQAVLGLLSLLMALAMARGSDSYLITLALMMLSMFCTFRYGYWRIDAGRSLLSGPGQPPRRPRRLFHLLPPGCGSLRVRHSLPGLLSNHLAAAPRSGRAARQSRGMAAHRRAHSHLQRAA